MELIDLSIPRRSYIVEAKNANKCPECSSSLKAEDSMFLVYVKANTNAEEDIYTTNDLGSRFCKKCPVVVLNIDKVEAAARVMVRGNDPQYLIAGIVNLDAIPEDKKEDELGTKDNPMPLVEFLPELNTQPFIAPKTQNPNDKCACGSGKKHKKCCATI